MIDMLRAWIRKLQFLSMFKTLMAICYPIFLKLRRSIDVFIWLTIWLMFDICEIILFNYYWCYLCYRSTTRISLHHLSWTILFFHHGVRGIWIWSIWYLDIIWIWYLSYGIASCCIALHCIGIMSYVVNLWFRTYRYSIVYWAQRCSFIPCWVWRQEFICIHMHTSLVWHRDAASYLDGYEGRSNVHIHAFLYGFEGWMWWNILRYIMNGYASLCAMAYQTLDILYVVMPHFALWLIRLWIYYMWAVWIIGYWFNVVALKLTWEVIVF